jgi:hypothetical protein
MHFSMLRGSNESELVRSVPLHDTRGGLYARHRLNNRSEENQQPVPTASSACFSSWCRDGRLAWTILLSLGRNCFVLYVDSRQPPGSHDRIRTGRGPLPMRQQHDPDKWTPVFGKRSCSNNKVERDDDSKKNHPALAPRSSEHARRYTDARSEMARKMTLVRKTACMRDL